MGATKIKRLMEKARAEQAETRARVLKRLDRDFGTTSFTAEYDEVGDRLYVTFGEPREGMALFAGISLVVIVDPDTLELLSIEVLHPLPSDGGFWGELARVAQVHGTVYVAPPNSVKSAAKQISRELAGV